MWPGTRPFATGVHEPVGSEGGGCKKGPGCSVSGWSSTLPSAQLLSFLILLRILHLFFSPVEGDVCFAGRDDTGLISGRDPDLSHDPAHSRFVLGPQADEFSEIWKARVATSDEHLRRSR